MYIILGACLGTVACPIQVAVPIQFQAESLNMIYSNLPNLPSPLILKTLQVQWAAGQPDWIAICYNNSMEILRV